jgi:hypothetical protein
MGTDVIGGVELARQIENGDLVIAYDDPFRLVFRDLGGFRNKMGLRHGTPRNGVERFETAGRRWCGRQMAGACP